jgi:tRNA(Ile)-lysidine synthase TilS/MesJ
MNEKEKYIALTTMAKHIGRNNAISMVNLYTEVFGEAPKTAISGTRKIRKLINELRKEGIPICSVRVAGENGYFLASGGSDLEDYCRRLRTEALKKLQLEATLRKLTLPKLLGEIHLNVYGTAKEE